MPETEAAAGPEAEASVPPSPGGVGSAPAPAPAPAPPLDETPSPSLPGILAAAAFCAARTARGFADGDARGILPRFSAGAASA